MNAITLDNAVTGIVGVRGIGKTTNLLKQALMNGAKERRALYVSADDLYFLDNKLVDLVKQLYQETDVTLLCIDEVHKYPNWAQELKNIADKYKRIRVLFTGSSSIDIVHGKYDLSRRVTLHHLYGFSFREYLEFYLDCRVDKITMQELVTNHVHIAESLKVKQILKHFNEYLRTGYYPFFRIFSQEREKFQAIKNTTQKTQYYISIVFSNHTHIHIHTQNITNKKNYQRFSSCTLENKRVRYKQTKFFVRIIAERIFATISTNP